MVVIYYRPYQDVIDVLVINLCFKRLLTTFFSPHQILLHTSQHCKKQVAQVVGLHWYIC